MGAEILTCSSQTRHTARTPYLLEASRWVCDVSWYTNVYVGTHGSSQYPCQPLSQPSQNSSLVPAEFSDSSSS